MTPEEFIGAARALARITNALATTEDRLTAAETERARLTSRLAVYETPDGKPLPAKRRGKANGAPTDPAAATAGILDPVST